MIELDVKDLEGLGVDGCQFEFNNLGVDTCVRSRQLMGLTSSVLPWARGQRVRLVDGSRVLFVGQLESQTVNVSGVSYRESLELINDVGVLERVTYSSSDLGFSLPFGGGRLMPMGRVVQAVFEFAQRQLSSSLEVEVLSSTLNPTPSGQDGCLAIIESCLKFCPSVRAYFNHADQVWCWGEAAAMPLQIIGGGITEASLRARYDLRPSCVAISGGTRYVYPEGSDPRHPDAYVYHEPFGSGGAGQSVETMAAVAKAANKQKLTIVGQRVPSNRFFNDRSKGKVYGELVRGEVADFWGRDFKVVKAAALHLVAAPLIIETLAVEDMYEQGESPAANYLAASREDINWVNVYVHREGEIAASPELKLCTKGLRRCKARISQKICLKSTPAAGIDIDALMAVLNTRADIELEGEVEERACATLVMDCILINRAKKVCYPVDNSLAPEDEDYVAEEGGRPLEDESLKRYAEQYYEATRDLLYDGQVVLLTEEFEPWRWLEKMVSLSGLRPEWEGLTTPVQKVQYDALAKTTRLTLGSRSPLGFDELIERGRATSATSMSIRNAQENPALAENGLPNYEELQPESIVPAVTANVAPAVEAKEAVRESLLGRAMGQIFALLII